MNDNADFQTKQQQLGLEGLVGCPIDFMQGKRGMASDGLKLNNINNQLYFLHENPDSNTRRNSIKIAYSSK